MSLHFWPNKQVYESYNWMQNVTVGSDNRKILCLNRELNPSLSQSRQASYQKTIMATFCCDISLIKIASTNRLVKCRIAHHHIEFV